MMPTKLFMLKYVQIGLVAYLMKIIHIELSDKRGKVTMPEVNRQNFLLEFLNILNNKRSSILIPLYDISILLILQ